MSSYSGPLAAAANVRGAPTRPAVPADSISFFVMRPPGPVPATLFSSTPDSAAILRASGDALTRLPPLPAVAVAGADAGAAAGAVFSVAGAGLLSAAGAAAGASFFSAA